MTYSWDAPTACSSVTVTPPNGLAVVAPDYNCSTGAFTFKTRGGNGSVIEYSAIGITGWTTNPNQFVDAELRTAADARPLTLKARQNGTEVTYLWNIRAQCPVGARIATQAETEPSVGLQASVYPNPIDDEFVLSLDGMANQPVQLLLIDIMGRPIVSRTEQVLTDHSEVRLRLGNRPTGVYTLTIVSPRRVQSLRLLKR